MKFKIDSEMLKNLDPYARTLLKEKAYWDKHIRSYKIITKIMEKAGFYDWVEELCEFKPTDSIIDVGCGTGNFLAKVIPKIHFGIGFDISGKACALCRQTFNGTRGMVPHDPENWKTPEKLPQHSGSTCESVLFAAQEKLPKVDKITMINVFNSENYLMINDFTNTIVLNVGPASELLKDKGRIVVIYATDKKSVKTMKGLFELLINEMNKKIKKEKGYTLSAKFDERTEKDAFLKRLQRIGIKKLRASYLNRDELFHFAIIVDKTVEK